ncbi:MAG TPA: beta-ketoacyl synthase chain length factor [Puia sp.]|nr:beta-ketoacyl synthase chain length factor [Puia sp.]
MLYIHHTTCISPQPADLIGGGGAFAPATREDHASVGESALAAGEDRVSLAGPVDGVYKVVEPAYPGIPPGTLRRMSKAVRLGVGAAMPLIRQGRIDGILIGTGNGGMEESVKFLRQIVDYAEGMLAPGHFVQSIPNAIASQIGLSRHLRGYNSTYVHRGLGFEHALIDASMLISENAGSRYLVGGVDEVSGYHYRIEAADGWYKPSVQPGRTLYDYDSPGSIAGEGAALFLVGGEPADALAALRGIETFHSTDPRSVTTRLQAFLDQHLPAGLRPALLLSGENGDNRALPFYAAAESVLDPAAPLARYKHLCGEYPTASAFAVWLALQLDVTLPSHLVKKAGIINEMQYILLYNNHKLMQHSFILLERYR